MNIKAVDDVLGVKAYSQEIVVQNTDVSIVENNNEIVKYTNSPEVQKDVDRYVKQREESINALLDARERLITAINGDIAHQVANVPDAKELDAFSKLVKSLADLTKQIDELTSPQKVETYLDPEPEEKKSEDIAPTTLNQQINVFTGTPNDILDIIQRVKNGNITK